MPSPAQMCFSQLSAYIMKRSGVVYSTYLSKALMIGYIQALVTNCSRNRHENRTAHLEPTSLAHKSDKAVKELARTHLVFPAITGLVGAGTLPGYSFGFEQM